MKIAKMQKADSQPTVVLASSSSVALELLAGKTLHQVGSQYDLDDTDVDIVETDNPKGDNIKNLAITIEGQEYLVAFSRNFPMDKTDDNDFLLKCEFRKSFLSVKDSDGTPKTDEHGNPVLDETKPYISFGKPTGITIVTRESLFTPEAVNVKATAGGGEKR